MPAHTPNILTVVRIVLVPVMVALIAHDHSGSLLAPAAVFGVAALTDAADGHIARSRNLVTTFGRLADPVADKLLVGGALVALVAVDRLAMWVAVVVIAREVAVTALRWRAAREGHTIAVDGLGKAKTGVQMLTITLLMVAADPTAAWLTALVYGAVAITVASGLSYAAGYAARPVAVPART